MNDRLTNIDQLRLHVHDADTFDAPDPESLLAEIEALEAKLAAAFLPEALTRLATSGRVVELCYHPDAGPGDGSGWSLLLDDRHHYGTLEALAEVMRGEASRGE